MHNIPKFFLCLTLLTTMPSCSYVRSAKKKVRAMISGEKTEVAAVEEVSTLNNEGSKKIVEITPEAKLQNLMRAFLLNPDVSYKKLLLAEIAQHPTLLTSEKKDEEIIAFVGKLLPLFQEQNKEAMEVAVFLAQNTKGSNREEARKILGLLVDYAPLDFLRIVSARFPSDSCALVQSIPVDITEEGKRVFLENRAKSLDALKITVQNELSLSNTLLECQTSLRNFTTQFFYVKSYPVQAVTAPAAEAEVGIGIEAPE